MFVVQAETEIDAPVAVVWAVLTDMEAYDAWSTMLHYRGGALAEALSKAQVVASHVPDPPAGAVLHRPPGHWRHAR